MGKTLKLQDWLTIDQAALLLSKLVGAAVTTAWFKGICVAGQCPVYVGADGQTGITRDGLPVIGKGWQKVLFPCPTMNQFRADVTFRMTMLGQARDLAEGPILDGLTVWHAQMPMLHQEPFFKNEDIQALAAKMLADNGNPSDAMSEISAQTEIEGLCASAQVEGTQGKFTIHEIAHLHFHPEEITKKASEQAAEKNARETAEQRVSPAVAKAKPSHLLTIAGMLELLLDDERPKYNQGSIAQAIEDRHNWYGASHSQITKLFTEAKVAAKTATEVVTSKMEAKEVAAHKTEERQARNRK